jgi:hypothetical protein
MIHSMRVIVIDMCAHMSCVTHVMKMGDTGGEGALGTQCISTVLILGSLRANDHGMMKIKIFC